MFSFMATFLRKGTSNSWENYVKYLVCVYVGQVGMTCILHHDDRTRVLLSSREADQGRDVQVPA